MKINTSLLFAVGLFGLTASSLNAQVAINNSAANPNASAVLDLNTGNPGDKGFLAPQASLISNTDVATIPSPATGLMVYNTNAGMTNGGVGYYYWNGAAWASLNNVFGGGGITNYVARYSPNGTTLSTGIIQDNGTAVGINGAPVAGISLHVNSTTAGPAIYSNATRAAGDSAIGKTKGVYGNGDTGVVGYSTGGIGVSGNGANTGVYGHSAFNAGIYGLGATGVYGSGTGFGAQFVASAGPGVSGSGTTYGGNFSATAGPGVFGSGTTYGGQFLASAGDGVSAGGTTFGGQFSATTGTGVAASGPNYGGNFISTAGPGVNAQGFNYGGNFTGTAGPGVNGSGTTYGGNFTASAGAGAYGTGVYGLWGAGTTSAGLHGTSVHAAGDSSIGITVGVYGSGPLGVAGKGIAFGGNFAATAGTGVFAAGTVYGIEASGTSSIMPAIPANTGNALCGSTYGLFVAQAAAINTNCAAIYAQDNATTDYVEINAWNAASTHYKILSNVAGGLVTCAGYDLSGQKVLLHCPETPEAYYEDYGEGQLVNGKAHIDLDPVFAKNVAISEQHPLRVFIQLEDNETCKGVIVKNKSGNGFDVVELNRGVSNTPFEWHVVCNIKDVQDNGKVNHVQDLRFEKAPPPANQVQTKN